MKRLISLLLALLWLIMLASTAHLARAEPPAGPVNEATSLPEGAVVRVVLFYSPSCGHCHYVIQEILPPLVEEYGARLEIVGVDVTVSGGQALYQAALVRYQIPEGRQGVPTLVIGETVLVGSQEIPERLPELIKTGLAAGGTDWPDIPGLAQVLAAQMDPPTATPSPEPTPISPTSTPLPTLAALLPAEEEALTATPSPGPPLILPTPTSSPTLPLISSVEGEVESSIRAEPVYLAYFFDPSCLECARVSAELVELQAHYPQLVVQKYELPQEATLNEAMCEKYGLPAEARLLAPIIFIGNDCLLPAEINLDRLQALIEDPQVAKAPPPWANLEKDEGAATAQIVERFNQFSLLGRPLAQESWSVSLNSPAPARFICPPLYL